MVFKGFSASYVALNPLSEEFNSDTDSNEMITPFPGSLKTVYVNRYKTDFDDVDEDEDDEDDDESNNSNVNQIHTYGHNKVPMVELEEDDDD